ncbi:alpha/beta fold hydrolase [Streptomyces griseoincarnatus]|uniref:alpha/beta fold hydrolase n=1 Tax=unclassified Streptomyces TaxID=2593676 RepID=UPI0006531CFF|nr:MULTISPECIES: alpha/beta hydrolase [unclassified Streptomyces]AXI89261.1 alpha/beta hydrolase [Streptomyces sp. ETH9427]MBU5946537.1 alpha/beta hydrolase [Streptomyces sp. PAM3C]WPW21955.1 alpha/beta hydrolase [Streptomyces griseoincarnatus]
MPEIELSAGIVAYEDTGGEGPVVVLLHGLLHDASVWRHVVAELRADHRLVAPTLPYGAHRRPMSRPPTPDLVNELIVEFLERLDLRDVTLVESDCGRAQTVAARHPERLARLVLISCEAFDNYPPGLPGKMIGLACRVPGGVPLMVRVLGWKPLRRLPVGFGALTKRPLPDDVVARWLRPLRTDPAIRRDFRHYHTHVRRTELLEAAQGLRRFERPALVVWATEDLMMPREHGRSLAELLPRGRLVELRNTRTLIAEDRPQRLASLLRWFVADG